MDPQRTSKRTPLTDKDQNITSTKVSATLLGHNNDLQQNRKRRTKTISETEVKRRIPKGNPGEINLRHNELDSRGLALGGRHAGVPPFPAWLQRCNWRRDCERRMRVVWEAPERGGGWAAGDDAWRSLGCARSLLRAVAGHRIHGVAGVLQLIEPVSGPRCGSGCVCSILEPSAARCPNHVVRGASLSSVQVPGPPGYFVLGDVATLRCAMAQFIAWPSRAGHGAAKKKRET